MSKKIVAIGGGGNGRIDADGVRHPYETGPMDREIIRLTGKEAPNFLLIAHSQLNPENEEMYYKTMSNIYHDKYGCECKTITRKDLYENFDKAKSIVDWADIIYEGGGDTKAMLELWTKTGFDEVLKLAYEQGKVMCGVSAGANCWFSSCSSDSLKIELHDETAPLIEVDCLGFINAFFTPHCNVSDENTNRLEHMKKALEGTNKRGIAISNCCAIEIVDDKYRLITSDASNYGIEPYGIIAYWKNGEYCSEKIEQTNEFRNLGDLLPELYAKKVVEANEEIFGEGLHQINLINAGFRNNVFDVDNKFIIKICGIENEEKFDVEARFYKENCNSRYIPKLYKYDNSKTIIEPVYEIIEKIEGKSLYYYWYKMSEAERAETIKEIANIAMDIHKPVAENEKYDWAESFETKVKDLYCKIKDSYSLEEQNVIEKSFEKYKVYLANTELAFIHNDLHFDNIIKNENGLYVIDFNDAQVAAIDFEFRLLFMCKETPWKWANEEMDPYQKVEDYKNIDYYIKKYYNRIINIKFLEQRMIIYRIYYEMHLYNKYHEEEAKNKALEHSKKLLEFVEG